MNASPCQSSFTQTLPSPRHSERGSCSSLKPDRGRGYRRDRMIHRRSLEAGRKGTPRGRDSKGRAATFVFEEGLREGEDRVRALRHSSRRIRSGAGASPDGRVPALAEVRLVEVRTRWPGDNSARGGTCADVQVLLFSITRLIDAPHTPVSIARP